MSNRRSPRHPSVFAAAAVYVVLLMAAMLEQFGKTTNDTKTPLIESPAAFLKGAVSLWNPDLNLGELQNQAYGYLFPQGPFYLLVEAAHVAPWVTERLWSTLVLVAGCEGGRRLARAFGLSPWAAWVAGMAYGLNPHTMAEVGVRSAEILPPAVLPWAVLPIVLSLTGRLSPRRAALFAVAAYMFCGAVNGTVTAAPLPLILILIVWAIRRGLARRTLLYWWVGLMAVTSLWWTVSLLFLNTYSPPFFDYVEDAQTTTGTTGWTASLRGASNWVDYIYTGSYPTWPAGGELAYHPWLVVVSGLVAAIGIVGLVRWASPWRSPLVASAVLGAVCLTVGHSSPIGSPLASGVQGLLDGPFALLRNVHKADPMLRLPVAMGVGVALAQAAGWLARARQHQRRNLRWLLQVGIAVLVGVTLATAQPAIALNLRTPGWSAVPDYWHATADYLAAQPGDPTAWVIPGAGFGVQTWGWTEDEPMAAVATTPWVTRSQVPLVPPETIRVLSRLEDYLASGAGSPNLGPMLARLGISYVVVRHDLDPSLAEATSISLVSIAMARSEGVTRVAAFGRLDLGPAIEIYKVDDAPAPAISVRPDATAVTVASASSDVTDAIGQGLIPSDRAAVVQGDSGWDHPADIVGDTYRLRERNFGRVHNNEGPVRAPGEPKHGDRIVPDYPANPASKPVIARYSGIEWADSSSSEAFSNGLGETRPETSAYSAFDADPESAWRSGDFIQATGQWLDVKLPEPRDIGPLTVTSAVSDPTSNSVLQWRVDAGKVSRTFAVNPITGVGTVDLSGVTTDLVKLTVTKVADTTTTAPASVSDVQFNGLPAGRTLVMPKVDTAPDADFAFTARPEVRTCITTLLAPDCEYGRARLSEESSGIDRTFDVPADGAWSLTGTVVARDQPATARLLDPILGSSQVSVHASSTLASDPTVSARMVYDGNGATTWMSDPFDPNPTLTVDFASPRVINRIGVAQPAFPAVAPTFATLTSGHQVRQVQLGGFGQFAPLRVKHLVISLSNPTRGLAPIGMSELYLGPTPIEVPLDGGQATGATCGFGPEVHVDGHVYPTQVEGFLGNVISAGPLNMTLCRKGGSDESIHLAAGEHRLQVLSTDQFQPVLTDLTPVDPAPVPTVADRSLTVVSDHANGQTVKVGAGAASLLVTTRNYNPGWVASLNGKPLAVQRVDGWAQGWRIPAGNGGTIQVRYTPERPYVIALVAGLAVSALVMLVAIGLLLRTRLKPEVPVPDALATRATRRRRVVRGVVVILVAGVFGGVIAVAGAVAAVLLALGRRSPLAAWLGGALMVAGTVLAATWLQLDRGASSTVADLLTGGGFTLAVASLGLVGATGGQPDAG